MPMNNFYKLLHTPDLNLYHTPVGDTTVENNVKPLLDMLKILYYSPTMPIGYRLQYMSPHPQGFNYTLVHAGVETVVQIIVNVRFYTYLEYLTQDTSGGVMSLALTSYPRIYFNAAKYRTFLQALEQEEAL